MNEQIKKVRAEIERRITMLRIGCKHSEANELLPILSFIDSLQDEPNPILAWVEENYKRLAAPVGKLTEAGRGYLVALGDIIRKFDSVPAQLTTNQNMVSSDAKCGKLDELEEEVNRYWNDHALEYRLGRVADIDFLHLTARHFAEWQKKQDEEKCQGCFDRDEVFRKGVLRGAKEQKKQDELEFCYEEAFDNGVKYTKEQMMREAVEGYVEFDFIDRDGLSHVIVKAYVVEDDYGIVTGDKCKCLILKDDETGDS